MKKYLSVIILLGLVACDRTLDIGNDSLGEVLLMNAQLCSSDTTHTIWLSLNSPDMISSVQDAIVSCFVNDRLVSQSHTVEVTDVCPISVHDASRFEASGYRIHAQFKPEDRVCIMADMNGRHCETHLVVPKAPIILNAETDQTRSHFVIRIRDIKDEYNYYSLRLYSEGCVVVEESGNPRAGIFPGDTTFHEIKNVRIDSKGEPLLNSGARTISNPGSTQESFFDNADNLFTDLLFRDGDYAINIHNPKEKFNVRPRSWETGDRLICYNKAVIRIFSHTTDEYVFLTGCEYRRSIEGNSPFSEPFVFPNNVEGGLGFVSISTSSDYVIEFPSVRFE